MPRMPIRALLLTCTLALGAQAQTLVVGNKRGDDATFLRLSGGAWLPIATLPTGHGPHEAAISGDGRLAVVTDYGTGPAPGTSLSVYTLGATVTRQPSISIAPYRRPHGVTFLPGDSLVAVTVEADSAVVVVSLAAREVVRVVRTAQGGTHMIALAPDGRTAYTANIGSGSISAVDLAAGSARSLRVAPQVEGIAVSPDGRSVWVGGNQTGRVYRVDAATFTVRDSLDAQTRPYRVAVTPDGRHALAPATAMNAVKLYDVATGREVAAIALPAAPPGTPAAAATSTLGSGAQPVGIVVSRDSRRAYVSCQGANAVAELDLVGLTFVRWIPVGDGPDGIALGR